MGSYADKGFSRHICVCLEFLSEEHKQVIADAAHNFGFDVRFFEDEKDAGLAECLREAEVLFAHSPELVRAASDKLSWYCCAYAGVDPYCADPGMFANPNCLLTNSSGAYDETIGEHLIMVALMLLRRMPEYAHIIAGRIWKRDLAVRSICDVRITVLGAGNIGSSFARKAAALGAQNIIGVNRSGKQREPYAEMYALDGHDGKGGLDAVLPQTDMLVMALPGTKDTVGILSRERIALLPQDALVINIGRGSAIDQPAIIDALNSGHLAGAALDVMTPEPLPASDPLWDAKNALITPHISGNMTLTWTRDECVRLFLEDLANYANGRPLVRLVDKTAGY
ncbi:MAG: D-2-hydroxyacid dehydrogenase [Coriobacteriales bacterium]|nr:D-2-hydroxyacid dehydrogenase [Coriobacteriales bacterium]